ncbi:MAG: hypothetical protein J5379_04795 [Clostridiales bacterium]|nr:hypothetical protein [Clostridiales bacterium]
MTDGSGSKTDSSSDPSVTSDEETAPSRDISSEMAAIADEYMSVLLMGDKEATAERWKLSEAEVLPSTYESDGSIYLTLCANSRYTYGTLSTSDYTNYNMDVTWEVPDIRGCIDEVLLDENFMYQVTQGWILAADDPDKEVETYALMWNVIMLEACVRIKQGTYTGTVLVTDYFSFHDNGEGKWLCTRIPEFGKYCSKDSYMIRLSYMDPFSIYSMMQKYGTAMVANELITQEKLDEVLEKRKEAILQNEAE